MHGCIVHPLIDKLKLHQIPNLLSLNSLMNLQKIYEKFLFIKIIINKHCPPLIRKEFPSIIFLCIFISAHLFWSISMSCWVIFFWSISFWKYKIRISCLLLRGDGHHLMQWNIMKKEMLIMCLCSFIHMPMYRFIDTSLFPSS